MAQLVVRNLDDDVKAKLQQRARQHGPSTEEEVAKYCAMPSGMRRKQPNLSAGACAPCSAKSD